MKIVLTKNQWERMSEILGNFSVLSVGSIVIPAVQGEFSILFFISGVVATLVFWYYSLVTARKY